MRTYGYQAIRSAYDNYIKTGNRDYYNRLVSMYDVQHIEANNRLDMLQRHGYDYYAYDNAVSYNRSEHGGHRYKDINNIDTIEELFRATISANKFLKQASSTVSGQKNIIDMRLASFANVGINIDKRRAKGFLKFLSQESVQDLLEIVADSYKIVDRLYGLYKKGGNAKKQLKKALDDFNKFEDDGYRYLQFDELMDKIVEIEDRYHATSDYR